MRLACCAILAAIAGLGIQGCSNTYRIPSASMEPTLHCGEPQPACLGSADDRVVIRKVAASKLRRGDVVVFESPSVAQAKCGGAAGTYVKRVIGLPGETVHEDRRGFIAVDGRRLREPYVVPTRRAQDLSFRNRTWKVPRGAFFVLGDNRPQSCDSRVWGALRGNRIDGVVTEIIRGGRTIRVR